ncbi:alpha/beta-hydrolase [Dacryopinax primogenitus]|uniref:Alpha/beta-hydrolase n=1 Tax=Dacryopinax primogenitus (strain DJM 731) TaxID=1858805 RepID=M5FQG2_DACPD|nr:alpha/beta-hydrolase [Dacryopinax primogenitus]EJT96969.1 alpha/beta-hydrolase [Dacryopinax primogenitus]
MLFLHGGSYITGSAHPSDFTSFLPGNSIHHSHKLRACLSVDYRLSSASPNPLANPFPAALLDALSGFRYLLSLGISPGEIIIAGDSAGGNLALALCKYLVEAESLGPVLGGLVLLSPWSDLTDSHHYPDCSLYRNYKTDYLLGLEESMGSYSVHAYCGGVSPWCPWISPGSLRPGEPFPGSEEERAQIYVGAEDWDDASFLHWPRTLLIPGSVEMIIDEIRTLKGKMMRDRVRLTYREWEGCPHDFMTMWFMEPERTQMLRFIGAWIDGEVNEEIATGETTD